MTAEETVDERPTPTLYIEPVYGTRSWNVTGDGELEGIVHKQVWQPGENLAECRVGEFAVTFLPNARAVLHGHAEGWAPRPIRRDHHRMIDCRCGFYLYREGSSDFPQPHYHSPGRVTGIVKGWGLWVEGSAGCRVERAQIVALFIPPAPKSTVPWYHRLRHFLAYHGGSVIGTGGLAGMVGLLVGRYGFDTMTSRWWALLPLAVMVVTTFAVGWTITGLDRCECPRLGPPLSRKLAARVRHRYRGVPVFDSLEAMLDAFPAAVKGGPADA